MNDQQRYQDYLDFIERYPKYLGNIGDYRDGETYEFKDGFSLSALSLLM